MEPSIDDSKIKAAASAAPSAAIWAGDSLYDEDSGGLRAVTITAARATRSASSEALRHGQAGQEGDLVVVEMLE